MARERRYSGVFSILFWALVILLATLVADCLYVMWPYPHGAVGVEPFRSSVHQEWDFLVDLCGMRLPSLAYSLHKTLHTVLFEWPGFDYMISRANDPAPMDSGGEMMRKAVLDTQALWGAASAGLQLFSARLAVILLTAPLMLLSALTGLADGLLGWFKRRSGGGRESGFVYHRAKRHAGHGLLVLGFAYLAPPVFVDPRGLLTVVAILIAAALRVAAASFKKYI